MILFAYNVCISWTACTALFEMFNLLLSAFIIEIFN